MIDDERELKLQEVREKMYAFVLAQLDDMEELERRYFMIAFAMHLLEGVQVSVRADLMRKDLNAILAGKNRDSKDD